LRRCASCSQPDSPALNPVARSAALPSCTAT
jgi:hypothetical protein